MTQKAGTNVRRHGQHTVKRVASAPVPTPSQTFNFTAGSVPAAFNFARASSATYWDYDGLMKTAASGVPRFDFDPAAVTMRGLLLEEARTNVARRSGEISATYYDDSTNGISLNRNQVDMFGSANSATLMAELATNSTHLLTIKAVDYFTFTSGSVYTQSIFVKAGTVTRCQVTMPSGAFTGTIPYANFSLTGAGSVLAQGGTVTPRIEFLGAGLYRLSITATCNASVSATPVALAFINADNATRLPSYLGSTGNNLICCGFQTEVGAHASSYIPTTTAAVTRVRDDLDITGSNFSSFYNQSQGTWITEFMTNVVDNVFARILETSDSTANNSMFLYRDPGTTNIIQSVSNGGVNSYTSNQAGWAFLRTQKAAMSYRDGQSKACLNGVLDAVTPSAGSMPAVNRLDVANRFNKDRPLNGWIRTIEYYNTRIANNYLQQYTRVRPQPGALQGLTPQTTAITATTGQTISGLQINTTTGNCIIIPSGVNNVTIEYCDIGPAGSNYSDTNAKGIDIQSGAYNITIRQCCIHDVASVVYANSANHPVNVSYCYGYNIRGPQPRGQMVQLNNVTGGSTPSNVSYNLSDAMPGFRYGVDHGLGQSSAGGVEDHFNFYGSPGLGTLPSQLVVASYNHCRGGHSTSNSGSAFILGDGSTQSGYQYAHHNVIVNVRNVGIGIAGGVNQTVDSNKIYMNNAVIYTNIASYVINYASPITCNIINFSNNRSWCFNGTSQNNFYWQNGGANDCTNVVQTNQTYGDTTLNVGIFGIDT